MHDGPDCNAAHLCTVWQSHSDSNGLHSVVQEKSMTPCLFLICTFLSFPSLVSFKLQALVYDILPSTTAIFSYAIRSRKLSANEQFFVDAQTVVSLLQTTQIISDVCFITDDVAYASSNKTKII